MKSRITFHTRNAYFDIISLFCCYFTSLTFGKKLNSLLLQQYLLLIEAFIFCCITGNPISLTKWLHKVTTSAYITIFLNISFKTEIFSTLNVSDCIDPASFVYHVSCLNLYTDTNLGVDDFDAAYKICQTKMGTSGNVAVYKKGKWLHSLF